MKTKGNRALWVVIVALILVLIGQQVYYNQSDKYNRIKLGQGEETFYVGDMPKEVREKNKDNIGVSIPAAIRVSGNKAKITIKNTGRTAVIPSVSVNDKEVYRASKALEPGLTVATVIPVERGAKKCVTLVESVEGGKFTVTSKLER